MERKEHEWCHNLCNVYSMKLASYLYLQKLWLHLSSSRIPHDTTWNVVSIWFSRISFIPISVDICYFLQIVPWSLTFCSQLAYMTLSMGHVLLSSFYVCIWILQWHNGILETINLKRFILLVTTLNVLEKIVDSLHSRRQCLRFQGSASFLWNVAYFSLGWPYVFCRCRQWDTQGMKCIYHNIFDYASYMGKLALLICYAFTNDRFGMFES